MQEKTKPIQRFFSPPPFDMTSLSACAMVDKLDLSNIRRRLLKEWPLARVDIAMEEYRKFLIMICCDVKVSPCPDVDKVWHEHLLHTHQYAKDCHAVLGRFLHHTPSTGSIEEAQVRSRTYQAMLNSYRTLFRQEPHTIWSECPPSIVVAAKNICETDTFDGCDC